MLPEENFMYRYILELQEEGIDVFRCVKYRLKKNS